MFYIEELVQIKKDEAVCTSIDVAEKFGKRHADVIRKIDNQCKNALVEERKMFTESSYTDSKGEERKVYIMNRQGFEITVMGFTGDKALEWKVLYSDAFNLMEKLLVERQSKLWQDTRKQGKLCRKAETDVLKQLVTQAEAAGSKNAKMLYINYSKLANKAVGIKSRDMATAEQLATLEVVERIILNTVKEGLEQGVEYHEIYSLTSSKIGEFKKMAYL